MKVILTNRPEDRGTSKISRRSDCACDCNCACPVEDTASLGIEPHPILSQPVAYYLELVPYCNNHCPGCGNVWPNGVADSLDGRAWCELIGRLASHTHQVKVTGGEPTLHPDFEAIIKFVDTQRIPFTLFTNGRWKQPARLVSLLSSLTTCRGLLVSLHGPDAATHEAFSGVTGSFDETRDNIRRAVAAGLDVATSFVITHHNWHTLEAALSLSQKLGAQHMVCNRWLGVQGHETLAPSLEQLRVAVRAIESLHAVGAPIRFGNCIPQCFEPSSSVGCTAGETFATVDPWGRVRPCNHVPLIVGDLRTQSLNTIWHSAGMQAWRARTPEACESCAAFATCHGGCRAQAFLSGLARDPLMQHPLLELTPVPDEPLVLYEELRPVGRFVSRVERAGLVLIKDSVVVAVPPACEALTPQLDGSLSLRQVEQCYGETGLTWIGSLYQQGMVAWL